jgi:hypothetical protein
MQGTYFVRHLKGNSGNQIQKMADSQATRTKVAHAVVYAKKIEPDGDTFVSDDTLECQVLWETATDNVFKLADAGTIIISKPEYFSTKHGGSCRIVANYRKFGGIESARLLVRSVKLCHRQLVGNAAHHLLGISKNHSTVSVFIVCGLILSLSITQ